MELAQVLVPGYAAEPQVRAVAVGGSVAAGCADRFSDIDLYVFWQEVPASKVERTDPVDHEEWIELLEVEGVAVEVSHFAQERIDRIFHHVLEQFDPDPRKQDLIHSMHTAWLLHDTGFLASYIARAADYPEPLARSMVVRHLDFTPRWYLQALAERQDLLRFYDLLGKNLKSVLGILLGLNRLYHPHPLFKSLDRMVGRMSLSPPSLLSRLRETLSSPPEGGLRQIEQLIGDAFLLVESHMPEAAVGPAKERYEAPGHDWCLAAAPSARRP